ncbi:hypothetical protein [Streptomyces sp. BH105]|uniref:hypothetical protein n=1 Tax=Streptomyces sp. BH105 TaxID=3410408 RepID=UPI003CEC78D6
MAVYGYDYYGKSLYGADAAVQYSVEPVTATSISPGHIQLAWGAATQNAWTTLRIVRNPFGVPAHGDDGTVVAEVSKDAPGRTWDDIGLIEGRLYYYGIFLGVSAWSSTAAYQAGDVVSYSGLNYAAILTSTGIAPGSDTDYWQHADVSEDWVRAGAVAGLSVAAHDYTLRLYQSVPGPYRAGTSEVTGHEDGVTNPGLFQFLNIFGHQLDTLATQTDVLRDLRDIARAPSSAVTSLAAQFGVTTEVSDEPIRRRLHASKAVKLARNRGNDGGIADLVNTLTGWDVEIEGSANLMLNNDQANWANPILPAWDKDLTYQGGDVVSYGDALWTATKSVSKTASAHTMTVTASTGTVTKIPTGGAARLTLSGATYNYVDLEFTIAADGVYDLSVRATDGTAYGKTAYLIDGVVSPLGVVDHYLSPVNKVPRVTTSTRYLGRYTLTAGTHTFSTSITGKNAAATGYTAGLYTFTITGTVDPSRGQEPVDGSGWWSRMTAATGIDVGSRLTNPISLGPSTWTLRTLPSGAYPAGLSVAAGLPAVTGTGTNNNAGTVTNLSTTATTYGVRSVGTPLAPPWSASATYVLDNLVRDSSGTVWRALVKNQGVTPGSARDVWEYSDLQGSDPLNLASMIRQWGVPLDKIPLWSPQVEYQPGERVAYQNFAYVARLTSKNRQPDGDAQDTTYWEYAGTAQPSWTASAYTRLLSGASTTAARVFIDWYDVQGKLITTTIDNGGTSIGFYQRFAEPINNLSGDRSYSTSWAWDSGGAWKTSGTWIVSGGVLTPLAPAAAPYKMWAINTIPWGTPIGDLRMYLTFMTRPRLGAAAEHGLVFRCDTTASNFWMASRTRLTKTVAGTTTVVATWPEVPDGGRIYVNHATNLIEVYQYTAPGVAPKRLASVDQATPDGPYFGLMERSL